jgi:hypothetical protein
MSQPDEKVILARANALASRVSDGTLTPREQLVFARAEAAIGLFQANNGPGALTDNGIREIFNQMQILTRQPDTQPPTQSQQ